MIRPLALSCFLAIVAVGAGQAADVARSPIDQSIREAESHLREGNVAAGLAKFDQLFEAHPDNPKVAQLYARHLTKRNQVTRAMEVYLIAIERASNGSILVQELERLYRSLDRDLEAMNLCLDYLEEHGSSARWVAGELESLLRMPKLAEAGLLRLAQIRKSHPKDPEVADLYLNSLFFAGQSSEALLLAGELDRTRQARGQTLYQFAVMAEKKGAPADALAAIEQALLSNPEAPLHGELLYDRARVLRKLQRPEEAVVAYDAVVTTFPDHELAGRSLYDKAQLLQRELNRYADAHAAYQVLLARVTPVRSAQDIKVANEVHLEMANCDLQLGRLEEAGQLYERMAEQATDPAVRVQALYQVAEMLFYQGRMEEAEGKYYELVDAYPTASWVNDALDRILQIGENSDQGGVPLAALAQAEFQHRLGNVRRAISLLDDAVASFPAAGAEDDLLHRKVAYLLGLGEEAPARAAADTLGSRLPDSPLAPRSYLLLAQYHLAQSGGEETARTICTEIILQWPGSIEAPVARGLIDRLQGRSRDSSALPTPSEDCRT